ncbi:hypothetical protein BAE44_0003577 [Dichanthelium oligosanthes]|uniref:Uncharacterized protein n=1 Tax=Dichanthelium oligosanthes TaxID=888268 RepID=A0A1E5WDD9_9POAL|nr:hypothetical protein BAE44_0003577 [Dichanthelium oligosanthes]
MLRLRNHLRPLVRAASQLTSPIHHCGCRRLLLSTSPAPTPFSLVDYLVTACGLAPSQARSAFDPDGVLPLLSGVGLSRADIADVVIADPLLLRSRADRLGPRLLALRDRVGLSVPQIDRFLLVGSWALRNCGDVSLKLEFLVSVYGSFEQLLVVMEKTISILTVNLDRVIKPNIALLRQCALTVRDIAKLCSNKPRLLTYNPERVKECVLRVEELGVPRGSPMFRHVIANITSVSEKKVKARLEFLM